MAGLLLKWLNFVLCTCKFSGRVRCESFPRICWRTLTWVHSPGWKGQLTFAWRITRKRKFTGPILRAISIFFFFFLSKTVVAGKGLISFYRLLALWASSQFALHFFQLFLVSSSNLFHHFSSSLVLFNFPHLFLQLLFQVLLLFFVGARLA